ncbi:hypothetical protein WN48_08787 [Eufriesea mexicana]|uniref:Uncharacterized protein n=1 Tax=Eufriesea mexicana TaxID=516756 RepID=A0A310SHQ3_9HYME|nr:hypothetical protein WN48_08787 [Eufriesea mexicana]
MLQDLGIRDEGLEGTHRRWRRTENQDGDGNVARSQRIGDRNPKSTNRRWRKMEEDEECCKILESEMRDWKVPIEDGDERRTKMAMGTLQDLGELEIGIRKVPIEDGGR